MKLAAHADASLPLANQRRRAFVEVSLATLAVASVILAAELLSGLSVVAAWGSAAVALAFLGVPLAVGRLRKVEGDVHALAGGTLRSAVGWGLALSLLVVGPFALGFDALQTQGAKRTRGNGPGLVGYPLAFSGRPTARAARVSVYAEGDRLVVYNGLSQPVVVQPLCAADSECKPRVLAPGPSLRMTALAAREFEVLAPSLRPIQRAKIGLGELGLPPDSRPIEAPRGWLWLLWSLLTQILIVALPEEAFFRGYVQGRLRAVWTPQRTVFGVPFGAAHVGAAALFALIHLVAVPAPARLLVFFPGLLFAWLAERNRNIIGAVTHHALSNLMLQVARRFYG